MTAIKEKTIELIKAMPDDAMNHIFDMLRERAEKEKKAAEEYADFPYPRGPLDPFLISPSGDPYWSYPGNVAALTKPNEGKYVVQTMEEFDAIARSVLAGYEDE
ncbi:hypothetical protein ACYULU_05520 [Breznakiellaceae bacterium SP9]